MPTARGAIRALEVPERGPEVGARCKGAILNSGLMPIDLSLAAITADKTLREQPMPLLGATPRATTRVDHTVFLLGHEYYEALKAFGSSVGLVELLAELKLRFLRARTSGESSNPNPEEPTI